MEKLKKSKSKMKTLLLLSATLSCGAYAADYAGYADAFILKSHKLDIKSSKKVTYDSLQNFKKKVVRLDRGFMVVYEGKENSTRCFAVYIGKEAKLDGKSFEGFVFLKQAPSTKVPKEKLPKK